MSCYTSFALASVTITVGIGTTHSIGLPIQVYPLYENGSRAHRRQSIEENIAESARLYADFAKISKRNPFSWNYDESAPTEAEISTVTHKNRMICFPCTSVPSPIDFSWFADKDVDPLLMNAFTNVNLAASCVLTSTIHARELGISESKWIYPLGGAGTQDANNCKLCPVRNRPPFMLTNEFNLVWERPDFHSSPSIARSIDACLEISGLGKEQLDQYDFYSCVKLLHACKVNDILILGAAASQSSPS